MYVILDDVLRGNYYHIDVCRIQYRQWKRFNYQIGQVPQTGNLTAVNNGAMVLKLGGFEVISVTHHLLKS